MNSIIDVCGKHALFHTVKNAEFTGVYEKLAYNPAYNQNGFICNYHFFIRYGDKIYMDVKGIGDIVITNNNDEGGTVYIIVDPSVVSRCIRLLSKELTGVGISLSLCEQNECMPHGSIVQDMKLNRTTERQIGRKNVRF